MELVQSDMIRILKPEFCNLPAQAIQCTLNDVTPEGVSFMNYKNNTILLFIERSVIFLALQLFMINKHKWWL